MKTYKHHAKMYVYVSAPSIKISFYRYCKTETTFIIITDEMIYQRVDNGKLLSSKLLNVHMHTFMALNYKPAAPIYSMGVVLFR